MGPRHVQVQQNQVKGDLVVAQLFQRRQGIGLLDTGVLEAYFHGLTQSGAEQRMVVGDQYSHY